MAFDQAHADALDEVANLRAQLLEVTRERDEARRCLAEHADCDEEGCQSEIEAARGLGPDPIAAALTARAERAERDLGAMRDVVDKARALAAAEALRYRLSDIDSDDWLALWDAALEGLMASIDAYDALGAKEGT